MKKLVGLKELRENVDTYISEVKKGKSFLVVRRSKPVFKITPPDDSDELWETVVDLTEFYKDGIPARQLLKKIRSLNERA
jgi:prevent-host-death family protein